MNIDQFLNRLTGVKEHAGGYMAKCPNHDDHNPSLAVKKGGNGQILLHCFAGCKTEDITKKMGLRMQDLYSGKTNKECSVTPPVLHAQVHRFSQVTKNKGVFKEKPVQREKHRFAQVHRLGITLKEYSDAKKLPEDFLQTLGVSEYTYKGNNRLKMPYLNGSGEVTAVRSRLSLDGDDKFRWRKGDKISLYGVHKLKKYSAKKPLFLVEGESDPHTLWLNNIQAVGLPGAANWNEERDAHYFDEFSTVYALVEPDRGGESLVKSLSNSAIKSKVKLLRLPCKDISDLWLSVEGSKDKFSLELEKALSQAETFLEHETAQISLAEAEAWETCQELAKNRNILGEVVKVTEAYGVTGEKRAIKVAYLALISRFLDRPISLVIKGPSSVGKSFILDSVLKFFPAAAFFQLTAMSDRALAYSDEPLKHRILILSEAVGLSSDFQSYLVRTLLSEGCISYEFVEKTKDGLQARRVTKEGPTGFICTTTAVALHPENETRMLSVNIKDTPEQTKNVLFALAQQEQGSTQNTDLKQWHALQVWLSSQDNKVFIPYANDLAEFIPPIALRLRRDFTLLLNLIKAHTILHQTSRSKDDNGRIIATIDDYTAVYGIIKNIFSEGLEATASTEIRETVTAVKTALEVKEYAKSFDVQKILKLDRSATYRRLMQSQKRGFIKNINPGKGKTAMYVLGDELPEKTEVLPTPEFLETCAPVQTCVSKDAQVEQVKNASNSSTSRNLCTYARETEGVTEHTNTIENVPFITEVFEDGV